MISATAERIDDLTLQVQVRVDIRKPSKALVWSDGCLSLAGELNGCSHRSDRTSVRLRKGRNRFSIRVHRLEYRYVYPPLGYDWSVAWDALREGRGRVDVAVVRFLGRELVVRPVVPRITLSDRIVGNG